MMHVLTGVPFELCTGQFAFQPVTIQGVTEQVPIRNDRVHLGFDGHVLDAFHVDCRLLSNLLSPRLPPSGCTRYAPAV